MEKYQLQGELWGKSPNGWADIQETLHQPLWKAMMNSVELDSGLSFLDVGCGAGGASILAANKGAIVTGIDAADGLLSFAKERVPSGNFLVADIENLPFDENSFDIVFASNSIQYSENRLEALRELIRVCKPKGRIVAGLFGSPDQVDYRAVFGALRSAMPNPLKGGGPFELSMPGILEGLFEEANLTNIETGEANCPFEYQDFDVFWYANVSAGPIQGMLNVVSENKLKLVVKDALNDFLLEDGRILIPNNIFKYVSATI